MIFVASLVSLITNTQRLIAGAEGLATLLRHTQLAHVVDLIFHWVCNRKTV